MEENQEMMVNESEEIQAQDYVEETDEISSEFGTGVIVGAGVVGAAYGIYKLVKFLKNRKKDHKDPSEPVCDVEATIIDDDVDSKKNPNKVSSC